MNLFMGDKESLRYGRMELIGSVALNRVIHWRFTAVLQHPRVYNIFTASWTIEAYSESLQNMLAGNFWGFPLPA